MTFINIWTCDFRKIQIISNKKLVYTKVVDLNQIYNFIVQNFFSWGCFGTQIYSLNFEFQIFKIFKWPQMEKKSKYESCSSPPDLQLCS